jgi:hypothetical protein
VLALDKVMCSLFLAFNTVLTYLLNRLDVSELRSLTYEDYDDFFQDLKKECCVSGDAILYRLCTENKITPLEYADL